MTLLYFAWLRTRLGIDRETLDIPSHVRTVNDLLDWLAMRGPEFASVLKERSVIRIAVNQEFVETSASLTNGDEVALFPPITGG